MWNHSLTLRLFLLPSRLLCSLARGGTCPLGPYRLIAYDIDYLGAPLMHFDGQQWILIGTLMGRGDSVLCNQVQD